MMINRPLSRERNAASINWRRGLFRLWMLISSAWMMGWAIYFVIEYVGGQFSPRDVFVVPVVLLGPPVAVLLLGVATRWAFQGFEA